MAVKPKTCVAMFAAAAKDARLSKANQRKCERLARLMARHPRLARAVEERVLAGYEADNGKIVGAVDWAAVWAWLVENLPTILKLLLSILAIFGL